MALIHADGFDQYADAAAMQNIYAIATGVIVTETNPPGVQRGTPRTGRAAYRFTNLAALRYGFTPTFQLIVGQAFKMPNIPGDGQQARVMFFVREGGGETDLAGVLTFDRNKGFIFWQGYFGANISSPPNLYQYDEWTYMEVYIKTTPGDTKVVLKINGQVAWEFGTNINSGKIGAVQSYNYLSGAEWMIDDLYIVDVTGPFNNDFLGTIRCRTIFTNANRADQDWSVTGAKPADQLLANVPPDNTQFISATEAGAKSSFGIGDVPGTTAAIYGVVAYTRARKTDAGAAQMRVSFSNQYGTLDGDSYSVGTDYGYRKTVYALGPDGYYWDKETFNGADVTLERTV